MTDDEIDAAIRAVVPAECFVPNAGARAIYRAGMLRAAQIARTYLYANPAAKAIERAAGGER